MVFFGGFFWDWLNVHTFNCRHRADRRVQGGFKEWVDGWAEGWADRWVAGGMGGCPVCEVWADS